MLGTMSRSGRVHSERLQPPIGLRVDEAMREELDAAQAAFELLGIRMSLAEVARSAVARGLPVLLEEVARMRAAVPEAARHARALERVMGTRAGGRRGTRADAVRLGMDVALTDLLGRHPDVLSRLRAIRDTGGQVALEEAIESAFVAAYGPDPGVAPPTNPKTKKPAPATKKPRGRP